MTSPMQHLLNLHDHTMVLCMALLVFLPGCGSQAEQQAPSVPDAPWETVDLVSQSSDGFRVLVLHDMEGLSGQDDWHTYIYGMPEYETGQEFLAGDMNAVISGLFAGGATEVHVVDGHGSTNPEPDLRDDLLDKRAIRVLRNERFDSYVDLVEPDAYDAVAVVGMHAKTGSGGFASHTITAGIEVLLNSQSISETEIVGLSWGRVGVPVIFASGDDKLADDLKTMPWLEYVVVKNATSASTATLRPIEEARADLSSGAQRAIENLSSAKVMKMNAPIAVAVGANQPGSLQQLENVPGIEMIEGRVTFTANDFAEAYDGIEAVVGAVNFSGILFEELFKPGGQGLLDGYLVPWVDRWMEVESGTFSQPDPTAGSPERKYHGFQ